MKEERERRWEEEGEGEKLGKKEMREWYKVCCFLLRRRGVAGLGADTFFN